MGRRLLYLIVVVALVVGAYYSYQNYAQRKQLADGDVQCIGCMSAEEEAQFKKKNAGEAAGAQAEGKVVPAQAPVQAQPQQPAMTTARFPDGPPAVTQAQPVPAPAPAVAQVTPMMPTEMNQTGSQVYPTPTKMGVPVGDTLPPNSPNGTAFVGKGPYQWYRQGSLTWRLNTETGSSCVAYATMEEWRRPIVLRHGCGSNI